MKKIILLFTLILFTFNGYSQEKGYVGLGLGYATLGGDYSDGPGGISMNLLGVGYMFSDKIGATLNLGGSSHSEDGVSSNLSYTAIGPLFRFSAGENMTFDLKPQYASAAVSVSSVSVTGSGFILGTSLNFSKSKTWGFGANLDYQSSSVGSANYSVISIGGGIQYRW